jgi:sulfur-carrier protein
MTPIRIPPMLREQVEGRREVLAEGETVRQVLEDVTARYPALATHLFENGDLTPFVNVYVGRDDVRTLAGLDTPVEGRPVILLPAMAGGCDTRVARSGPADYAAQTVNARALVLICEELLIVRARLR